MLPLFVFSALYLLEHIQTDIFQGEVFALWDLFDINMLSETRFLTFMCKSFNQLYPKFILGLNGLQLGNVIFLKLLKNLDVFYQFWVIIQVLFILLHEDLYWFVHHNMSLEQSLIIDKLLFD